MSGPSEWQILALGAFAGLTIFLGLPFASARGVSDRARAALAALAVGILLFLFVDVLSNAHSIVTAGVGPSSPSSRIASSVEELAVVLGGFAAGALSLVVFEREFTRRLRPSVSVPLPAPGGTIDPVHLSTVIAVGIGFHNLSEGLAIGAAYAAGLPLAIVLVIGFAVHNSTEGFGILGPGLLQGRIYSARRLIALGLVGGGPTFLGTVLGSFVTSPYLDVLFYGLAAGAILYVVLQMGRSLFAPGRQPLVLTFIVLGFALGVLTDFLVTLGGG
ncbi:MAG: zinc permease [Thermoplasmata archaeon]|nr:zinc permease [Thermoplasmata archaeon]